MLSHTKIYHIPDEIGKLLENNLLTEVHLHNTKVTHIPIAIQQILSTKPQKFIKLK